MTHRVIRGYWPDEVIDRCKAEIDSIADWQEKGFGKRVSRNFPPVIASVIEVANSPGFIKFFHGDGLFADPKFRGGGVHSTLPGGFLRMHRDFNHIEGFGWRVSNLLLYLNRGCGGDLLVNGDRIPAEANTMVFLSPEDWHGHPEPCAERRDSIALYYYSKEKPEGIVPRVTTDYEWTEKTK